MKNEIQLLYRVMRNFEGMQKIDVFDLLHKMEVLLFYASSPISKGDIQEIINASIEKEGNVAPFQITILPNGKFCEFVGSNDWIHMYKECKKGIWKHEVFNTYYYNTKYSSGELKKLTKKNLLNSIEGTAEEVEVLDFLKKKNLTQKDAITGKLLILEL